MTKNQAAQHLKSSKVKWWQLGEKTHQHGVCHMTHSHDYLIVCGLSELTKNSSISHPNCWFFPPWPLWMLIEIYGSLWIRTTLEANMIVLFVVLGCDSYMFRWINDQDHHVHWKTINKRLMAYVLAQSRACCHRNWK
jgi:hypothetical protein